MMSVMLDNEVLVQYQLLKYFLKIKGFTDWAAFHTSLAPEIPLANPVFVHISHFSKSKYWQVPVYCGLSVWRCSIEG
jgi:hypothetical protein